MSLRAVIGYLHGHYLFMACASGNEELVNLLCKYAVDAAGRPDILVAFINGTGKFKLQRYRYDGALDRIAAANRPISIAIRLLKLGADPNIVNNKRISPFMMPCLSKK